MRRFPPPWSMEPLAGGGFKVLDADGQSLAYVAISCPSLLKLLAVIALAALAGRLFKIFKLVRGPIAC
jgi:hypothetical protein